MSRLCRLHKGKEKLMTAIFRNFTRRAYAGQTTLGAMDPIQLEELQNHYLKQGIISEENACQRSLHQQVR